jgi:hypothetical protein
VNEAETVKGGEYVDAISRVKHVLLPITDRNPYLSEGTRQVLFLSLLSYVKRNGSYPFHFVCCLIMFCAALYAWSTRRLKNHQNFQKVLQFFFQLCW